MSTDLQHVRAAGVDPRAIGTYEPRLQSREDHGPYYVVTVGEPIHRVDKRDGVPHLYPMHVECVKTWAHWTLQKAQQVPNALMTARNADGETVEASPIFAGDIVNDILVMNPQYAMMGTVSISAFTKVEAEQVDIDNFNRLIMPEPIWYDLEEVPVDEVDAYKRFMAAHGDAVREEGALRRRERLLKAADFSGVGAQLRRLYEAARAEILQAFATYKTFGINQLGEADRQVKDRDKSGKSVYDRADLRRQWLFKRKGVDAPLTEQQAPVFSVQMPEAKADVERRECDNCGEMIAVKAKACRYCGVKFGAVAVAVTGAQTPTSTNIAERVDDAEEFDDATSGRKQKTLAEKQAEMKAKK